jgi:glucose/arabinose dehydrogenase
MRAAIWVSDLDGKNLRQWAGGLRNTVFFTFDKNGKIWGNDMGRDLLGDNLPPEELNIIEDGGDYGWPFCYGDRVRDEKYLAGKQTEYCQKTRSPIFKYPAHVAPLGITFDKDGNLIVAFHGSWNSSVPVGYKVVKLRVKNDQVTGTEDFISSWLTPEREVLGRPVDVVFDEADNLYISDDRAGVIYKVSY